MDPILLANLIAGVHSVLVFYFLIGWLIPFAPFRWRCISNLFLGGIFLYYRFNGECPLTVWERSLRSASDPFFEYGPSFLARLVGKIGLPFEAGTVDTVSFYLILGLVSVGIIFLFMRGFSFKIKKTF